MKFDFSSFVTGIVNKGLKENEQLSQIIELLNKYGIYGERCITFLMELSALLESLKGKDNEEK